MGAYLKELVILIVKLGMANMVSPVPIVVDKLAIVRKVWNKLLFRDSKARAVLKSPVGHL